MDFICDKCPRAVGIAHDIAVHGPTEKEQEAKLHNLMLEAWHHGLVFYLDKCHIKENQDHIFWHII